MISLVVFKGFDPSLVIIFFGQLSLSVLFKMVMNTLQYPATGLVSCMVAGIAVHWGGSTPRSQ